MASSTRQRLERDLARLRQDLERYRAATEAGLNSLDEVTGWLDRNQRAGLARDLRRNRKNILQHLRGRPRTEPLPVRDRGTDGYGGVTYTCMLVRGSRLVVEEDRRAA